MTVKAKQGIWAMMTHLSPTIAKQIGPPSCQKDMIEKTKDFHILQGCNATICRRRAFSSPLMSNNSE